MPIPLQKTAIIRDAAPLSLLSKKQGHSQGDACKEWCLALEAAGSYFDVPGIADFELRLDLLRASRSEGVNSTRWITSFG